MGPSGVLSGTQYYTKRAGDDTERPVSLEGPEGTFALIHYDLWHRGGANLSQKTRAMMKFQFVRMNAPTGPAWKNERANWGKVEEAAIDHNHTLGATVALASRRGGDRVKRGRWEMKRRFPPWARGVGVQV